MALRLFTKILCAVGIAGFFNVAMARADESIALKSGESAELGPLYWISHCRSILKSPPLAEMLEGPSELTVSVREAKVLPRRYQCAQEVPGGVLVLSATDIKEKSQAHVTIRIKYPTRDGERQHSRAIEVSLFP
jgi:hypothetical protein